MVKMVSELTNYESKKGHEFSPVGMNIHIFETTFKRFPCGRCIFKGQLPAASFRQGTVTALRKTDSISYAATGAEKEKSECWGYEQLAKETAQ